MLAKEREIPSYLACTHTHTHARTYTNHTHTQVYTSAHSPTHTLRIHTHTHTHTNDNILCQTSAPHTHSPFEIISNLRCSNNNQMWGCYIEQNLWNVQNHCEVVKQLRGMLVGDSLNRKEIIRSPRERFMIHPHTHTTRTSTCRENELLLEGIVELL